MTTGASNGSPRLSIVLPAFNEARRIVPSLDKIQDFVRSTRLAAEVLVVDDGSTDDTPVLVQSMVSRFGQDPSLRLLRNPGNRGKGFSVRHGVLESSGAEVLFTDSDLSSPIEEYRKLAAPIERGEAAIAIGSRALPESRVEVRQSWLRETYGRVFNLMVRKVTGLPFRDTQCGFKLFTRPAAQAVFRLQKLDGFGFDVEILYIAQKLGFGMVEIPVVWRNVEGSQVRLLSGARAFLDVLRVLREDAKGSYATSAQRAAGD